MSRDAPSTEQREWETDGDVGPEVRCGSIHPERDEPADAGEDTEIETRGPSGEGGELSGRLQERELALEVGPDGATPDREDDGGRAVRRPVQDDRRHEREHGADSAQADAGTGLDMEVVGVVLLSKWITSAKVDVCEVDAGDELRDELVQDPAQREQPELGRLELADEQQQRHDGDDTRYTGAACDRGKVADEVARAVAARRRGFGPRQFAPRRERTAGTVRRTSRTSPHNDQLVT